MTYEVNWTVKDQLMVIKSRTVHSLRIIFITGSIIQIKKKNTTWKIPVVLQYTQVTHIKTKKNTHKKKKKKYENIFSG